MKYMGYFGWTSYWNIIYYRSSEDKANRRLRRHELKHIEQIASLGKFRFTIEYLYQSIRYGYLNNKFEVEARAAEDKVN